MAENQPEPDTVREQPATYHALNRSERDHLLAAAQLQGEAPSGQRIQQRIATIRGNGRPSNPTTYTALGTLSDMGLLEKHLIDGNTVEYWVTDDGLELLDAAAAEFPA